MKSQKSQVNGTSIASRRSGRQEFNIPVSAQDVERLWALIVRGEPSDCWLWRGSVCGCGKVKHGQFTLTHEGRQYALKAHRVVWEQMHGTIPSGLCICHRCDEPRCCNPAHLFLGTQQENLTDARQKGRLREWMPRHPLSVEAYREILLTKARGVDLARKFGVTELSISRIRNGRQGARVSQMILQDQARQPEARLGGADLLGQLFEPVATVDLEVRGEVR